MRRLYLIFCAVCALSCAAIPEVEPNEVTPQTIEFGRVTGETSINDLDRYQLPIVAGEIAEISYQGLGPTGFVLVTEGTDTLTSAQGDSGTVFAPIDRGTILWIGNQDGTQQYTIDVDLARL